MVSETKETNFASSMAMNILQWRSLSSQKKKKYVFHFTAYWCVTVMQKHNKHWSPRASNHLAETDKDSV